MRRLIGRLYIDFTDKNCHNKNGLFFHLLFAVFPKVTMGKQWP
jgi:hypothetical protein